MSNINLGDLKELGPEKQYDEKGKRKKIKVKDVNKDNEQKIKGDLYKDYEEFDGYKCDQFKFPLQKNLYRLGKFVKGKETPPNTFLIGEQEQWDLLQMPLPVLDIEKDVMDDFTVVIAGRRRSGKSWVARWIMYNLRSRFPCGVVITGTKLNDFWAKYVPEEFIHNVEDIDLVLDKVYKRQEFIITHPELGIDPRMFIVLDDVLKEKYKIRFSKALSRAFTDGRHHKVFTLITTQDPKGIPPDLRENTDLCVIFRQFQRGRKEAVCEEYLDYIEDKKQRYDFLWNHTGYIDKKTGEPTLEEDGVPVAICVIQARLSDDLQQIFKKIAAEDPGDFILGDTGYWKAMETGRWKVLAQTFDEFKKRN